MATELEAPGAQLLSDLPRLEAVSAAAEDEEEHWLYGDDPTGKHGVGPIPRRAEPSHPLQDAPQEIKLARSAGTEVVQQALQSDEEDSDSDSDEDDVRVTIGNIKTGPASYMAAVTNVNFKTARGYGGSVSAKLPPKGIDLDALGNINGVPVLEVDLDLLKEKPWRKPGADLSDYFNYGFNEDTWKAYCEKQKQLQLGLDPTPPLSPEDKVMVYQGRTGNTENESENFIKSEYCSEFASLAEGRVKAGPPPNRKLAGTIDVIGGHLSSIRRVEGRRRDNHPSEENPIQVIGDPANNPQPPQQSASQPRPQPLHPQQPPPQAPQPQHLPFVTPTGPLIHRPPIVRLPPPHFMHPPPPVTHVHPPMHPPGLPPPNPMRGLFPPPLPPPPPPRLLIPTLDSSSARYNNRHQQSFVYNSGDGGFISYPALPTTHTPWVTTVDKGTSNSSNNHWQYTAHRRDRDRERERDRPRTPPRTPPTNEHNRNDEERYHYYSKERCYDYDHEYRRSRDDSREQEDLHRERRHREKEESTKHKSSRRKPHETEEVETHRRHKHKKNKRSKDDKPVDEGSPLMDERVIKE